MTAIAFASLRRPITAKIFWIRTNRVLAWSLIVSAPVQWILGIGLATGIATDLGILLAHAALSFTLFGKPETKKRVFSFSMHLFGLRASALSARNVFLLTGYRIAGGMVGTLLFLTPVPLVWLPLLYPLLRMPVSVCQHILHAVTYALRRWGMRGSAEGVAALVVLAYVVVSILNLFR